MKNQIVLFFFLFSAFLIGCAEKSDQNSESDSKTEISKSDVTTHVGELFEGMIKTMRIELDTLETSFNIFQNEPSTENLETIQSEWKELATTIQQATFLNLGPIQTKYGFLPINYWPVNSVKIEEVLESDQELNDEFMSTAGNSIKGVWALEDLLFDHGKTPEEMLKEFDGSKGNQRMAFVRA